MDEQHYCTELDQRKVYFIYLSGIHLHLLKYNSIKLNPPQKIVSNKHLVYLSMTYVWSKLQCQCVLRK